MSDQNSLELPNTYANFPKEYRDFVLPPLVGRIRESAPHVQYAVQRYERGGVLEDIAFELGVNRATISRMLRDQFVRLHPKGPRRPVIL